MLCQQFMINKKKIEFIKKVKASKLVRTQPCILYDAVSLTLPLEFLLT